MSFWIEILTTVYAFPLEHAELALLNPDTMITKVVHDYLTQFNPPIDFFHKIAKFQRMMFKELVDLGEFSVDSLLDTFLDLMPSNVP